MTKRKQPDDVILIEEEPENLSVPPPTTDRVAVRIISKEKVNQNGASRFLVKWKNQNEETWETEDFLRSKYPDLVDDYEYHRLTDQRLKDKGPSNSRKAVKQASKSLSDTQQVTQKSKRSMQALKQMSLQQQQQFSKLIATPEDKVEKVSLIGGLFKIEWKKRPDGDTPFSDHFSYEQLSQTCSLVCMKFIETIVFERSDRTFPVQFFCEGETYNDRYQAVQYAIHGRKVTDPQVENGPQFQVQISLDEPQPIEGELVQVTQNDTTQEQPQDQQLQLVIEVSVPNSPNNEPQREQSHAPEQQVQLQSQQQLQLQPQATPIIELPEVVVQIQEPEAVPVEVAVDLPVAQPVDVPVDVAVAIAIEVPDIVEPKQVFTETIEIEDAPQEQAPQEQVPQVQEQHQVPQLPESDIVPSLCAPVPQGNEGSVQDSQHQQSDEVVALSQIPDAEVPVPVQVRHDLDIDLESLPDRPSVIEVIPQVEVPNIVEAAPQPQVVDVPVISSLMIEDAPTIE